MKKAIFVSLIAGALGTACASESPADDPLAGESANDGEAGKADTADAFTFFSLSPAATGEGFVASRPNRAKTLCLGGHSAADCAVESIDWSATGLDATATAAFEQKLRDGSPILVRGDLASDAGPRVAAKMKDGLASLLAGNELKYSFGDESGPDCLYGRYTIANVVANTAAVTTSFDTHSTLVRASFDDVSLSGTSEFALTCVDGTAAFTVHIAHASVSGLVTGTSKTLTDVTVTLTGVTYDAPGMPDVIGDQLRADPIMKAAVSAATSRAYASLGDDPVAPILAATEVWVPGSDTTELDGTFVFAKDNGVRCITAPCPSISEQRVNANNREAEISSVDLAASGASDETVAQANSDIATGTGVIIVGDRITTDAGRGKARRAAQFWTRAK